MPGFTASIHIEISPETLFAILIDLESTPLWVMGMVGTEPLQRGPIRTGFRYRETRHIGAKESTRVLEIVAHEGPDGKKKPPYTHVLQSVQMGIETTYYYLIEDDDPSGARVDMTVTLRATNPFSRLFLPWVVRELKKQDGGQLVRLKDHIETMPVRQSIPEPNLKQE